MNQLPLISPKRIHIAIMRKSWGLTEKITAREKTIESRWYKNKSRPWNQIGPGETIYFKNSGKPVTIKAVVDKVLQFENLTPEKIKEILNKYGQADGLGINTKELDKYFQIFKDKKYCLIIFLKNPQKVKPFKIKKSGFGTMAAWITVDNLAKIKYHP
jgi:ASC-1-like (ASCH) protein